MTKLSQTVAEIERIESNLSEAQSALSRIVNSTSGITVELAIEKCFLSTDRYNTSIGGVTIQVIEKAIKADFESHLRRAIETMEADISERKEKMLIQAAQFVAGKAVA